MTNHTFFQDLPALKEFSQVCHLPNYTDLPNDWHIIVADVVNSTDAVQSGSYKAVNMIGVSILSSIVNIAKPIEIPYIFGGDGASLSISNDVVSNAKVALIATRHLALQEFSLDLRIGIVSIDTLRKAGVDVLVAKHKVSKCSVQAAFAGGGLEHAEMMLKSNSAEMDHLPKEISDPIPANYSGLECRWDNVPSKYGETIALIVKALSPSLQEQAKFYEEVIHQIKQIYGNDETCRPVYASGLRSTFNKKKLGLEARLKSFGQGDLSYLRRGLMMRAQNVLGWLLMNFNLKVAGIDWGNYKNEIISNSDFRKFDGILRQVISGTADQRQKLTSYLEDQYNKNKCVYGLHCSSSALVTCLINNRSNNHYHFVDGADGGYAMAALNMKRQLKNLQNDSTENNLA